MILLLILIFYSATFLLLSHDPQRRWGKRFWPIHNPNGRWGKKFVYYSFFIIIFVVTLCS